MLKIGDERTITDPVLYSDTKWLAGRTVRITAIDHGEDWENTVVEVRVIITAPDQTESILWMNPRDFEPFPLYPVHDEIAQALGGFRFDANDPFGGLPILAEEDRATPGAHSDTCYICRDPDFAARGLPLCRACPACGGHIAADDSICDDCGLDDSYFWQFVIECDESGQSLSSQYAIESAKHMFVSEDYKPKDPTVKELHLASRALCREISKAAL